MVAKLGMTRWAFGLSLVLAGCSGSSDSNTDGGNVDAGSVDAGPAHFEYTGEDGPEHWGDLSAAYATCKTGQAQSPIDIGTTTPKDLPNLVPAYVAGALAAVNNGHTIQVNVPSGSKLNVEGVDYPLLQFHFHHPSEHTVNGVAFPLEMHLVHKAADGSLAVVGVLIKSGAENAPLKPLFSALPATAAGTLNTADLINPADLLPADKTYFKYAGSLTTPPCSEGVKWHVLKNPVEMSDAQLNAFSGIFSLNARPVQSLNARELDIDSTP